MSFPEAAVLPRVLLIDDDAISRELLAMMLEMHGFPVDPADDGAQALKLLKDGSTDPEVILMDTQMPGLSGVALLKALRRTVKTSVRIVAISGSEGGEALRQAADGFLLKPVEPEALVTMLEAPIPAIKLDFEASASLPEDSVLGNSKVIDPDVLNKLRAMMPATAVMEIYAATASDLPGRLAALAAAMDAGDAVEVARIAHAIKGGCAMVGLSRAVDATTRLETSNAPETWPKELSQLRFALKKLQSMLGNALL